MRLCSCHELMFSLLLTNLSLHICEDTHLHPGPSISLMKSWGFMAWHMCLLHFWGSLFADSCLTSSKTALLRRLLLSVFFSSFLFSLGGNHSFADSSFNFIDKVECSSVWLWGLCENQADWSCLPVSVQWKPCVGPHVGCCCLMASHKNTSRERYDHAHAGITIHFTVKGERLSSNICHGQKIPYSISHVLWWWWWWCCDGCFFPFRKQINKWQWFTFD